jgi:GT2 family glycosyltransferase
VPTEERRAIAVVICCRDRAALLEQALVAVRAALEPGDELVVVDSGSTDPEVRAVAERAGATVVVHPRPGLSRARNAGWRATTHEVVAFTDDDCLPAAGWRRDVLDAFADDSVGAAWGDVVADRGSEVPLSSGHVGPRELTREVPLSSVGHGASMAFRRSALEDVGGFDELLGAGGLFRAGEDKDALWRVLGAGWRVVAAPGMAVTHVVHRETAEAIRVMKGYGVGAGAVTRKRVGDVPLRQLLQEELWVHGLQPTLRQAKAREWPGAQATAVRTVGMLQGWWRARRLRVVEGHLVPRDPED